MMTNGLKVIGISIRTTNQNNQASVDLGALWGRFFAEEISNQIPHKVNNDIVVVYTDYKSNYTEEYTAIIGVEVNSLENIPAGLVGREFPAAKWRKFIAQGEMPQAVVNTWIEIWKKDHELNREYSYDLEIYGEKSQMGANSEVDILIAIKDNINTM